MKKIQILSLSLALMGGTTAFASFTATLYDTTYNNSSPAGEFKVVTTGADFTANYSPQTLFGGGFATFCIDRYDTMSYGVTYDAVLSSYIVGDSGNQLSLGSAYLYSQFATGTLAGYDYNTLSGRRASDAWLQKTLWALEGEYSPGSVFVAGNPFYNDLLTAFGSIAAAQADANGAYGVWVLQLTDSCGNQKQSQLVLCPVVPEPSTVVAGVLLLLPFGVSALRILRKKPLV